MREDAAARAKPTPAVLPDTGAPEFDADLLVRRLPPYKVIVHDSPVHTFQDVITVLCRVVDGMTPQRALGHATEVHTTGASVVATVPKERAEHYQQGIGAIGLKVSIEPA
jgi:ATP-dependent Clp protease adaptor protein ClpS